MDFCADFFQRYLASLFLTRDRNKRSHNRGETFPKLKIGKKLSLDVTALPSYVVSNRDDDCFPHLSLFACVRAFSARWWIKVPTHIRFENARDVRAPPTLLNSFPYYVFSGSECNLPDGLPSPGLFTPRTGRKGFSFRAWGNKYTPQTNCPDDLTSRASARCDDLITITYKNAQHVDPPLCYSCTSFSLWSSLLVCRISPAGE